MCFKEIILSVLRGFDCGQAELTDPIHFQECLIARDNHFFARLEPVHNFDKVRIAPAQPHIAT